MRGLLSSRAGRKKRLTILIRKFILQEMTYGLGLHEAWTEFQ